MANTMQFRPATLEQSKLRAALWGVAGSGKTFTALRIATGLLDDPMTGAYPPDKIGVVDTEHGRAAKYANVFKFLHLPVEGHYEPERYVEAIQVAAEAGIEVLIFDSISHEWAGIGGILSFVDEQQAKQRNKLQAWQAATPRHDQFVEALMAAPMHVICTIRAKMKYAIEEDERGKMQVEKLGEGPIQRDNLEYEFDIIGSVNRAVMTIQKSMAHGFLGEGEVIEQPGPEIGRTLREWVGQGEPPKAPEQASDEDIAKLTRLRLQVGDSQKRVDDIYARMRQKDKGVLRPDWVAEQIAASEAKLAEMAGSKGALVGARPKPDPDPSADAKGAAGGPEPGAEPTPRKTSLDAQAAADSAPDDMGARMDSEADALAEAEAQAEAERLAGEEHENADADAASAAAEAEAEQPSLIES
jgi:hypothetical protein